jgi:hypothetical protein
LDRQLQDGEQQSPEQSAGSSPEVAELQRLLQKAELALSRAQAAADRHKQVIEAHEKALDDHISHKQELESSLYKHV